MMKFSPETFPFDAVLWDIDGTLADSEPAHEQSFIEACRECGLELPENFHGQLVGKSDEETFAWLVSNCGLQLPLSRWLELRFSFFFRNIEAVDPIGPALNVWRKLDALGVRQATVSNSDRLIVNANLARLGLAEPRAISVSRNDVVRGKPHPEPYLRAAELLGVAPGSVAVVEDSATGLKAATSAGMRVFMMPGFQNGIGVDWLPFSTIAKFIGS
jgi:HAD superfamily hydrolase (TIGR01509 family)